MEQNVTKAVFLEKPVSEAMYPAEQVTEAIFMEENVTKPCSLRNKWHKPFTRRNIPLLIFIVLTCCFSANYGMLKSKNSQLATSSE
jgi:hypothetical protein